MQGAAIRKGVYYRCLARTLAPGSPVLADHPRTVNLREDALLDSLNVWIGEVFAPENRDETVAAMLASQDLPGEGAGRHETAKKRLTDAKARLRRHQAAIEAGVDPSALVEVINQAQAERAAAEAELANLPATAMITDAEIHAMIDSLGDVGAALNGAKPDSLSQLYQQLRLDLRYMPHENAVEVTSNLRVVSAGVRGASCTLATRDAS